MKLNHCSYKGAAETIRREEKNDKEIKAFWAAKRREMEAQEKTIDNPETNSRPATADTTEEEERERVAIDAAAAAGEDSDVPFNIYYVAADTGWGDDHRTAKIFKEGEEAHVSSVVYDGWVREAMSPKQGQYDAESDDYEMVDEIVLPLWSDEQIEATSMYIQRALHYTTGKVQFKKY